MGNIISEEEYYAQGEALEERKPLTKLSEELTELLSEWSIEGPAKDFIHERCNSIIKSKPGYNEVIERTKDLDAKAKGYQVLCNYADALQQGLFVSGYMLFCDLIEVGAYKPKQDWDTNLKRLRMSIEDEVVYKRSIFSKGLLKAHKTKRGAVMDKLIKLIEPLGKDAHSNNKIFAECLSTAIKQSINDGTLVRSGKKVAFTHPVTGQTHRS